MTRSHTVVKNDNLSLISKKYAVPLAELKEINQIENVNKLRVGQVIFLERADVMGFQALFLDRDRNPIIDQPYSFEFAGRILHGQTGPDGLTRKINADSPTDLIRIAIQRLDASTKVIAEVISGYGNKLVTIVSPKVKVQAKTAPHNSAAPAALPATQKTSTPLHSPSKILKPTSQKPDLGLKETATKAADGNALTKVEGDIPDLEFLDTYNGEVMVDADYVWAADQLGVEKAAIKAFAVVESGGAGFFKLGSRTVPKILYERHKFAKLTKNKYSKLYPDISLPNAYYNAKAKYVLADDAYKTKKGVDHDIVFYRPTSSKDTPAVRASASSLKELLAAGKVTAQDDKYLDGAGSYKRLLKAYQLDKAAALQSCSWGAFQIMGEYWSTMKYPSAQDFTQSISRSPKEQIKSFVAYIKYVNPSIKKYLKNLDWPATAAAYNGPSYRDYDYDGKLAKAYTKFKDEK